MTKVEKLVDELVALNVTELLEFKKVLADKYGLKETVAVVTQAAPEKVEKIVEQTSFTVLLTKVSEETKEKLTAVKEINKILNVGLKGAMDLAKTPPVLLKENATKEEAEAIRSTFAALNAEIQLK